MGRQYDGNGHYAVQRFDLGLCIVFDFCVGLSMCAADLHDKADFAVIHRQCLDDPRLSKRRSADWIIDGF